MMLQPESTQDAAALLSAASRMGCTLTAGAADDVLRFRDLLAQWNRVYNLTAVRDPQAMWSQHLLDSLSIVAPLDRHANGAPLRILDVGAGGGLPGAVIAMVRPAWTVVSVDAVAKKARFVRQVALELGLPRLLATHSRIEALPPVEADVIVSRAFASLSDFARLTRPHLTAGGVWAAMKGKRPDDELAQVAAQSVEVFHVEHLQVPDLDADRHLIWMRPA